MRVLITGGAGFIGANFIRLYRDLFPDREIFVVDAFKYSGHKENLEDLLQTGLKVFELDICNKEEIFKLWQAIKPQIIFHFAAESHVDRSILSPENFVQTNIYGTFCLLESARLFGIDKFVHISTDEVYGSIYPPYLANEDFLLHPSSPYSSSKASADLLALSYCKTFGVPVVITRSSNNYGPWQTPEKFIPLAILKLINNEPVPIYGDGLQIRNWIYVQDNCFAISLVAEKGRIGEIYNIGNTLDSEVTNLEIAHKLCSLLNKSEELIKFVKDRPAHDRRYALDCAKLTKELRWKPRYPLERGLLETLNWYERNGWWVQIVKKKLEDFLKLNYENR